MAAGLNPKDFWDQSPRSFVTIMEGAARAANRQTDRDTLLAYRVLQFYGLAQRGKLKSVSEYLIDKPSRPKAQTAEQMLAVLKGMARSGTPMNIRQVN